MKLALLLEYDGSAFCGWQQQPQRCSVADALEDGVATVLGEQVRVVAAGRTDAGVHARAQVAHLELPDTADVTPERLCASLNGVTPAALCVRRVVAVDDSFHARHSEHSKTYEYILLLRHERGGLIGPRGWAVGPNLDIAAMISTARLFEGTHDFRPLQVSDCGASTTVRTVHCCELERVAADVLRLRVGGSGFLKHMIRTMAGTIVSVGRGERTLDDVSAWLANGTREEGTMTAPAHALTLVAIRYAEYPELSV